jgi:hypothetical protein
MVIISVCLNVSPFGSIEESSMELFLSQGDNFEGVLATIISEIGCQGFVLSSEVKVIAENDQDSFTRKTEEKISEIINVNNKFREEELKNG